MHHIYSTPSFVLSTRASRENDRVITLFTKDFGLVVATAQGIRKETSKLRGILVEGAFVDASLIRGKNVWRVITASPVTDPLRILKKKDLQRSYARVLSLIERLVRGEEKHSELFSVLEDGLRALLQTESARGEGFEIVLVSRILYELGYLDPKDIREEITKGEINDALFLQAESEKRETIAVINRGLRASGLE